MYLSIYLSISLAISLYVYIYMHMCARCGCECAGARPPPGIRDADRSLRSKVPKSRVFSVSVVRIIVVALGRYLIAGYLDTSGGF